MAIRPLDGLSATPASRAAALGKGLAWLLFALCIGVLVVAVAMPSQTLANLRDNHPLFGDPLNWLDAVSPDVDLTHVILFAGATFVLAWLWRRSQWWRGALPMIGLAIGSELLQFGIPGRQPLMGDLAADLLGIAVALVMAIPIGWHAKRQ